MKDLHSRRIRVRMYPSLAELEGIGGINTVVTELYKYLPKVGIDLVDDEDSADVVAVHAGAKIGIRGKPVAALCHGLYWATELMTTEEFYGNSRVIESLRESMVASVPSEWVAQVLQRDMHMQPYIVPHGIDATEWQSDVPRQSYALWNKGRAYDSCDPKWVGILANAFPESQFVSTFAPEDRPYNEAHVAQHGNIVITGILPFEKMKQIIQGCSIYLSTTSETFGVGILEALASGAPVLSFDEGNPRKIIQHQTNGYLAKDEADLVAGFAWLLEHADEMRDACRARAAEFNWQVAAKGYRNLFEDALRKWERFTSGDTAIIIPCYNRADTLARTIESRACSNVSSKRDRCGGQQLDGRYQSRCDLLCHPRSNLHQRTKARGWSRPQRRD